MGVWYWFEELEQEERERAKMKRKTNADLKFDQAMLKLVKLANERLTDLEKKVSILEQKIDVLEKSLLEHLKDWAVEGMKEVKTT